jgi:hypothetical protein
MRRETCRGWILAAAFGAGIALSGAPSTALAANGHAAHAGPSIADAKKHYGAGEKEYKAGDYAAALTDFQAADAIKSTPQSQRYIGLCQDKLGHYAEAVVAYEKFLAAVPKKMKKEGEALTARVAEIKAMPAHLHVETTPAGASILADGKEMGKTPADVELAPGKHIVHIELAGYLPIDKDVDVSYGEKQSLTSALEAKPVEKPVAVAPPPAPVETPKPVEPPPEKKEAHSKLPAFITGGLAIVAVGVGTGFGIAALAKKSEFDTTPTADIADTGENFALVADMAFGVAITLGVTSAVLFLTKDDDDSGSAPAKTSSARPAKKHALRIIPTPLFLPNGGGAGAFVRF